MKCVIRHLDEKFVCHENAISKAKKYNKKISIIINLFLLIIISMLKVLFPTRQLLKSNKLIPLHNKKKRLYFITPSFIIVGANESEALHTI